MKDKEILEELKKAEKALEEERNLEQVTFYEGYIKGLKYGNQALKKQREEIVSEIEERMETHTHDSIPSYTAGLDEGCVICIKNKTLTDLKDKLLK